MKLAELNFSDHVRPTPAWRASATERTRANVMRSIEVQRELLAAARNGTAPNLTKTVKKDGQEMTVARKPRRWFFKAPDGSYMLEILYFGRPISPLGNGKSVINCGSSLDDVERVLGIVAEAAAAGELDDVLATAKQQRKPDAAPATAKKARR